jgi:hypothetical protein
MGDADRLAVAAALVDLARVDWAFADLYLRDAGGVLAPLCGPGDFPALAREQARVSQLSGEMRTAVERGDWRRARELADEGSAARRRAEESARLFGLARAVHGPRRGSTASAACERRCRRRAG